VQLELIRVLDDDGAVVHPEWEPRIAEADLRRIYQTMVTARLLDERMLRLQRQGRIGFSVTATGEGGRGGGPRLRPAAHRLDLLVLPGDRGGALPRATRCAPTCARCSATPRIR
jgi:hypothetical protein